jgi:hypothetical protein
MTLNLQRIAWAVVVGSFFMFCGLCAFTVYAAYGFLFQSTVPMTAIAQASSGSLGITGADLREDVERGTRSLALGNIVRPNDQNSQGSIVIHDPYRENAFVASVTLLGDSTGTTAALRAALRSRFGWGSCNLNGDVYCIEVTRVRGALEVNIAESLPGGLSFDLMTDQRARIHFSEPGWYELVVRDNTVSVTSHGGTALIYGPDRRVGYSVTAESGSVYTIDSDIIRAQPQAINLLQNSGLDTRSDDEEFELVSSVPLHWGCRTSIASPRGQFLPEERDGRGYIRMMRTGTDQPGVTSCQQGLAIGEPWIDISGYSSLRFRASMFISSHSLPVCGFEGSECPIMLRIDYLVPGDEPGALARGELIYGFYTVPGPADPYDQTCASCIQQHTRVQENAWYSFDSGNVLAAFPSDRRPVAISRVEFYASGHEYDVRLNRIELIAANGAG